MRNSDLGVVGIIAGIIGTCYGIYSHFKMEKAEQELRDDMKRLCDKIDKSIDEVSDEVDLDVSEAVVEKAIDRAVDREVTRQVERATTAAINTVSKDITNQIRDAVHTAYTDIEKEVSDRVAKQVADIDMHKMSKSVREKAEQKILDKFDDNLDDLTAKYNNELRSVSKIYNSIANAMSTGRGGDKETVLRIS